MSEDRTKQNATVLIVEDEEPLRAGLRDVLKKNHFSVIEAKDGQEAVSLALSKKPDLILLDVIMPVMGGIDALKKIREDSWGKEVPVIMLTNLSATDEQLISDMITHGPSYYLIKSDWKIHDIVAKIAEVLEPA